MRIIGSAPRMERASAPSARADMDGTIGNVMDNDTGQASITALASQPRSLHVSTGDSVDSSDISTSTSAPPPHASVRRWRHSPPTTPNSPEIGSIARSPAMSVRKKRGKEGK